MVDEEVGAEALAMEGVAARQDGAAGVVVESFEADAALVGHVCVVGGCAQVSA